MTSDKEASTVKMIATSIVDMLEEEDIHIGDRDFFDAFEEQWNETPEVEEWEIVSVESGTNNTITFVRCDYLDIEV